MNRTIQIAPVRKSVVVEATPGEAFEFFTAKIDLVGWEINGQWKPDARADFSSEVEVTFIAEAGGRTRVELEHRNFEKMESGGEEMRNGVDNGWPGILDLYAALCSRRTAAA